MSEGVGYTPVVARGTRGFVHVHRNATSYKTHLLCMAHAKALHAPPLVLRRNGSRVGTTDAERAGKVQVVFHGGKRLLEWVSSTTHVSTIVATATKQMGDAARDARLVLNGRRARHLGLPLHCPPASPCPRGSPLRFTYAYGRARPAGATTAACKGRSSILALGPAASSTSYRISLSAAPR